MDKRRIGEIDGFLKKVREIFDPELIILFGSRTRGEPLKSSDYDLLIVSEKFKGIHFLDRIYKLLELWDYDWDVDFLVYTPEEFEKKKEEIGIVREAVKEGIEI